MKVTVSKLDTARSHLEAALGMYFEEKNPVSVHTLAASAYDIIKDVNRKNGGQPMLVKEVHAKEFVQKLGLTPKEVSDILNEPQNFFKHADRDADKTLSYDDRQAELLLFEACGKYCEIAKEKVPVFGAFILWFTCHNPQIVRPGFPDRVPPLELIEAAKKMTRGQWRDFMLAACGRDGQAVWRDGGRLVRP